LEDNNTNRAVLLLGSSGWIKPSDYPRVPIWANEIVSEGGKRIRPTLRVPVEWIERQGWATASLVTVSRPVLDTDRAEELRERVQADMVDMESYAVLQACASKRVPCGVVRVITDQANIKAKQDYWRNLIGTMGDLGHEISTLISWLHREERLRLEQEK
jgi:nucleoside phosphorylase